MDQPIPATPSSNNQINTAPITTSSNFKKIYWNSFLIGLLLNFILGLGSRLLGFVVALAVYFYYLKKNKQSNFSLNWSIGMFILGLIVANIVILMAKIGHL